MFKHCIPYNSDRLIRKMMNRMWILYEREVPLRERCTYTDYVLYDKIVNTANMKRWYDGDYRFKKLFDLYFLKSKMKH